MALGTGAALYLRALARDGEQERCQHNLIAIGLAFENYHSACDEYFPYGAVPNNRRPTDRLLSWHATALHFIEANGPHIVDESKDWDDPANRSLGRYDKETMRLISVDDEIRTYQCPSARRVMDSSGQPLTQYVGIAGLGADSPTLPSGHLRAGIFGYDRITRTDRITDGLGATMAVVETAERNGPWKAAGPATIRGLDQSRGPYLGASGQFGRLHHGGAMVLFADGSVRFVKETIDPKVFEAMSTIAGGEPVPSDWNR